MFELVGFNHRRPLQRTIDRVEAPQSGTLAGAAAVSLAQLRIELGVAGLKQPCQRALFQRTTRRAHLGEFGAPSKHVEKAPGLPFDTGEQPQLVERDTPGIDREEKQEEEDELGKRRRLGYPVEHAATKHTIRRAIDLRLHGHGVVTKSTHEPSVNYKSAPLGKRRPRKSSTAAGHCQTYDKVALLSSPGPCRTMIRFLRIRDMAVIDRLELELDAGFTILTGETGAGKSIVVGALGLLRGARASSSLVRTGAERAIVEAVAEDADGGERVLRREIAAQGRSRAFVDDRLVSTASLRTVGAGLLDLHGQHEHQVLLDPSTHLDLLDRYAKLESLRGTVRDAFTRWQDARRGLKQARTSAETAVERAEIVALQLRDIEEVDPLENEDETLAAQRRILANAERIHQLSAESYAELYDGDHAALGVLNRVWKRVEELARFDAELTQHVESRAAVLSQLAEMAYALRRTRPHRSDPKPGSSG